MCIIICHLCIITSLEGKCLNSNTINPSTPLYRLRMALANAPVRFLRLSTVKNTSCYGSKRDQSMRHEDASTCQRSYLSIAGSSFAVHASTRDAIGKLNPSKTEEQVDYPPSALTASEPFAVF
jgi:hypothetical protein